MIEIKNKRDCCGCCVCASACPKGCIEMREDEEGFVYPQIDRERCINCHRCEKACPVLNVRKEEEGNTFRQRGYIAQHRNPAILKESTAGGAFTAIAKYVTDRGGTVFGAALHKDLFTHPSAAYHKGVETEEQLHQFRNSKYIQSYMGDTARQVRQKLEEGRYVCFSGTPCQAEGIKQYLDLYKADTTRLILVDVVCRAVPSPMIFRKYLEHQEKKYGGEIQSVRFRDKHYGYKYSTMKITSDKNGGNYHRGIESDPWLRAFFSGSCNRPSCHTCRFRKLHRESDFTIWDCFHPGSFSKETDNDKGTTRILVHTEKGQSILEAIRDELTLIEVPPERLIRGSAELLESVPAGLNREAFLADAGHMDGYALFEQYFPETMKVRLLRIIRTSCLKLGIYSMARGVYTRLKGQR